LIFGGLLNAQITAVRLDRSLAERTRTSTISCMCRTRVLESNMCVMDWIVPGQERYYGVTQLGDYQTEGWKEGNHRRANGQHIC